MPTIHVDMLSYGAKRVVFLKIRLSGDLSYKQHLEKKLDFSKQPDKKFSMKCLEKMLEQLWSH